MVALRPPLAVLLALACLLPGCGDRCARESIATDTTAAGAGSEDEPAGADTGSEWDLLQGSVGQLAEGTLADLEVADAAGDVPSADTHFPIEGPRKGALFSLGVGRGFYEFSHNEHWGVSALYLYDDRMRPRHFDAVPALNVYCADESLAIEPSRTSFDDTKDGGWHFEDDELLGYPDAGRFRFTVDGRTYTPVFAHIHVGHGHTHAAEHATGPHLHGLGPHRGYILTLGAHLAHVEVVHKSHWGILGVFVYDAAMDPRELDEPPILNIVADGEPLQMIAGLENWDGEEDGGWHFESDALLGETGSARFRLVVDGKTYTPPFTYYRHGEEPGHSHGSEDGAGAH